MTFPDPRAARPSHGKWLVNLFPGVMRLNRVVYVGMWRQGRGEWSPVLKHGLMVKPGRAMIGKFAISRSPWGLARSWRVLGVYVGSYR